MKRAGLLLGTVVILAANVIALVGVSRNRAGEPLQTIELTERELPLQSMDQDNTGVGLVLSWSQTVPYTSGQLDRSKMEDAGFDFQIPANVQGRDIALLPRVAYIALEYEGKEWERWLQAPENEKRPRRPAFQQSVDDTQKLDRYYKSRLFLVDSSRSMSTLRSRYPDQSRYLILRAVLGARVEDVTDPATGAVTSHDCSGFVSELLPSYINVPLPYARILSPLKSSPRGQEPRYTVTLKYGRNLEPWVDAVKVK